MNVKSLTRTVKSATVKHASALGIGIGIICFGSAVYSAVKATPKALELIEQKKRDLDIEEDGELPVVEVVKTVAPVYILPAVEFTLGCVCVISSHKIDNTKNAALAAAYKLSETALQEYQKKVIETIGEKKERQVRHDIMDDRMTKTPYTTSEVIITEKGNTLVYESQTGRYFKSDIEAIRRIINDLNYRLQQEHWIALNDFFDEINLERTDLGRDMGWNIDDGLIDIRFGSTLTDDGQPCLTMEYMVQPRREYWR